MPRHTAMGHRCRTADIPDQRFLLSVLSVSSSAHSSSARATEPTESTEEEKVQAAAHGYRFPVPYGGSNRPTIPFSRGFRGAFHPSKTDFVGRNNRRALRRKGGAHDEFPVQCAALIAPYDTVAHFFFSKSHGTHETHGGEERGTPRHTDTGWRRLPINDFFLSVLSVSSVSHFLHREPRNPQNPRKRRRRMLRHTPTGYRRRPGRPARPTIPSFRGFRVFRGAFVSSVRATEPTESTEVKKTEAAARCA